MTHTTVGTGTANSSTTALAVTINRPVEVGSTLLLSICWEAGAGTAPIISSVVDSAGNTWTTTPDVSVTSDSTVSIAVLRARITSALVPGNTVTVTIGSSRSRWAAQIDCFDDLDSSPLDQTATSTGTDTTLSSGTTSATTAQAELVYAIYGFGQGRTVTGSEGLGMGPKVETSAGSSDRALQTTWYYVSSTGTQSSSVTIDQSGVYAGAIATYKVNIPLPGAPEVPLFSPGIPPDKLATEFNTKIRDPFTFLLKKPVFRARRTTSQTLAAGHQFVSWNQVDEDNYSGWSSSQPTRYTAPVGGYYLITAQVSLSDSVAGADKLTLIPAISRNGDPPYKEGNPGWEGMEPRVPITATHKSVNSAWEVYANRGDYLELDLWYSSESTITATDTALGWQCSIEIVWSSI